MPKSGRLSDSYRVLVVLAIGAATMPTAASARLPEALHSLTIRYVSAIHYPTGCVAMLEYDRDTLLGAVITDPSCLPRGVTSRSVPAFRHDFHLPRAGRGIVTSR